MLSLSMDGVALRFEERKEKITDKLSTQYSLSRISIEEYERLIKYSQEIETEKELTILEQIVDRYQTEEKTNNDSKTSYYEEKKTYADAQKEHMAFLTSKKNSGVIKSGNYVNILSDHKIIINAEDLINDETVLNFSAILGNVTMNVPENVDVVNNALTILSDVSIADNVSMGGNRKKIIIMGNFILSGLKIKIKKKFNLFGG